MWEFIVVIPTQMFGKWVFYFPIFDNNYCFRVVEVEQSWHGGVVKGLDVEGYRC
jgi:hypothetical protein